MDKGLEPWDRDPKCVLYAWTVVIFVAVGIVVFAIM